MDVVSQYILIAFVVALEFAVIIGQTIAISRIHRYTAPWVFIALGFLFMGGRQVWNMLRIPLAAERAKQLGITIPSISIEQWILITAGILAGACFIIGFDALRRHYQKIGI